MLQVKLLQMPLAELEQNIALELDDNPALEERRDDFDDPHTGADTSSDDLREETPDDADGTADDSTADLAAADDSYERKSEREEREEALDNALANLGSDDEMPQADHYATATDYNSADYEEMVWGDTTSFYDKLKEQMGLLELTDQQLEIMEYLIGSLDDDGILRKPLDDIADELAIYHGIDISEKDVEDMLRLLQRFDPAGIGARSLQECLLLQVQRRPASKLKDLMTSVLTHHYDDFVKKHWDKISTALNINDEQATTVHREILKLNPKPEPRSARPWGAAPSKSHPTSSSTPMTKDMSASPSTTATCQN